MTSVLQVAFACEVSKQSDGFSSQGNDNMYRNWLNDAGIKVEPQVRVEISPLFALSKEELCRKIEGMNISGDKDIYLE